MTNIRCHGLVAHPVKPEVVQWMGGGGWTTCLPLCLFLSLSAAESKWKTLVSAHACTHTHTHTHTHTALSYVPVMGKEARLSGLVLISVVCVRACGGGCLGPQRTAEHGGAGLCSRCDGQVTDPVQEPVITFRSRGPRQWAASHGLCHNEALFGLRWSGCSRDLRQQHPPLALAQWLRGLGQGQEVPSAGLRSVTHLCSRETRKGPEHVWEFSAAAPTCHRSPVRCPGSRSHG